MGHRIPDLDTEAQEPAKLEGPPTLVDAELEAPRTLDLDQRPTVDLLLPPGVVPSRNAPRPEDPQIFATWDESREFVVGRPRPSIRADETRSLRRIIRWLVVALAASIAAQLGGFIGARVVPALAERMRRDQVTYQRVWKSARSLEAARRLGIDVPDEVVRLQREAEVAAFAGDAIGARRRIDAVNANRSNRSGE